MHTLMVITTGLVLLGACVMLGRWLAAAAPTAGMVRGARLFLPLWLIAAGINLWSGVKVAGYTVAEELPVFLVVYAVPAVAALLVVALVLRRRVR